MLLMPRLPFATYRGIRAEFRINPYCVRLFYSILGFWLSSLATMLELGLTSRSLINAYSFFLSFVTHDIERTVSPILVGLELKWVQCLDKTRILAALSCRGSYWVLCCLFPISISTLDFFVRNFYDLVSTLSVFVAASFVLWCMKLVAFSCNILLVEKTLTYAQYVFFLPAYNASCLLVQQSEGASVLIHIFYIYIFYVVKENRANELTEGLRIWKVSST